MQPETDPNVVYGGDPSETTAIDRNVASLGEVLLKDFALGEDRASFVSYPFQCAIKGHLVKF